MLKCDYFDQRQSYRNCFFSSAVIGIRCLFRSPVFHFRRFYVHSLVWSVSAAGGNLRRFDGTTERKRIKIHALNNNT